METLKHSLRYLIVANIGLTVIYIIAGLCAGSIPDGLDRTWSEIGISYMVISLGALLLFSFSQVKFLKASHVQDYFEKGNHVGDWLFWLKCLLAAAYLMFAIYSGLLQNADVTPWLDNNDILATFVIFTFTAGLFGRGYLIFHVIWFSTIVGTISCSFRDMGFVSMVASSSILIYIVRQISKWAFSPSRSKNFNQA